MTKKKKVIGVAGLAAVALVGGTFAYFSQSTTVDNPFDTAKYGTVVTEDFNPEDGEDWEPGAEVNKDLYVDNTGDRDVVVRVKFEDYWSRNGKDFKVVTGADAIQVEQENATDGEVEADKSVVHKYFANTDKWMFNSSDGYFYYKTNLGKGQNTGLFLDKVKLTPDTDMGELKTQYYFTVAPTGAKPNFTVGDTIATSSEANKDTWIAVGGLQDKDQGTWKVQGVEELMEVQEAKGYLEGLKSQGIITEENKLAEGYSIYTTALTTPAAGDKLGYSDAGYILRITVETVQATDVAVKDVFGLDPENLPEGLGGESGWKLSKEALETTDGGSEPKEFTIQ